MSDDGERLFESGIEDLVLGVEMRGLIIEDGLCCAHQDLCNASNRC